ncbi:MAG: AI-2E family transporter, partial [Bacteroidota bacterium]
MESQPSLSLLPQHPIARWLFVLILAGGIYFFHGFLVPVLAALIIGFASWPMYHQLVRACGGRTTVAASIALFIVLLFLVIPSALLIAYGAGEFRAWAAWLAEANRNGIATPEWISNVPFMGKRLAELWQEYISSPNALGDLTGENLGNISKWVFVAGGSAFHLLLSTLFILMTLFFVY